MTSDDPVKFRRVLCSARYDHKTLDPVDRAGASFYNTIRIFGVGLCQRQQNTITKQTKLDNIKYASHTFGYIPLRHNGLRTSKAVTENGVTTTTNYIYNGKLLTHLEKNGDNMHFYYDAQGRPAMVDYNGTKYTYLHNLQGDVIGIAESTGALVVEYKYDAWGLILDRTGSLVSTLGYLNPFRYRGYVYDEEMGLCYLQSRYYCPLWERFISADVTLGRHGSLLDHNILCYCLNNPIILHDNFGFLFGISITMGLTAAFVGVIVGAAIQLTANAITGESLFDGVLGAAIGGAVYNVVSVYTGNTAHSAY